MAFARWRRAPIAVLMMAAFLASLSPVRPVRADEVPAVHDAAGPLPTSALTRRPQEEASTGAPLQHDATAESSAERAPNGTPPNGGSSTGARAPISPIGAVARADGVPTPPLEPQAVPMDGNDKTGVSSQAIALPQGTGKIQGMGESFSTQLSTGVATFTVPFALLPARGGAQPSLSLSYSSGSGHGVSGVGWDVGVAFIARQTDRGLPLYHDPGAGWAPTQDRFVFNGGQELIPICQVSGGACSGALPGEQMPAWGNGWQYFRPRVEGGFLRFFWSPDHRTWRVQSKTGTSMELGAPLDGSGYAGALETDPTGSKIFRWDLVREYDAYGGANPSGATLPTPVNVVAYRYLQDGGMSYLSDVYDTPPVSAPAGAALATYAHHVRLSYETRTDPTISFTRGWQTIEALRLTGVDITSQTFAGGGNREMVRRYHLTYDPAYHVSLLSTLQMEGRCNTTEDGAGAVAEDGSGDLPATSCPMLPAMTFGYQHVAGYTITGSSQPADLVGYEPFDERVIDFANSPTHSIDEDVTDLFDINADGLPDVLVTNPSLFNGNLGVYFNGNGTSGQANAFSSPFPMTVSGVAGEDANAINLANLNVSAADIDGDGVIDLVHMPQVQTYSVYTPVGSGTNYAWFGRAISTASQQSPKIDFGDDAQNIQVVDVNGDGLVDVVYTSGTSLETFFSLGRYPNGDGQFGSATWTGPNSAQISNDPVQYCLPYGGLPVQFNDSNTKLADMNGDGLQDIVYTLQGNITYWPGRGNGYFGTGDPSACPAGNFGQNTGIAMTSSPWYSDPNGSNVRLDDVNGDGLDDIVQIGFDFVEIWLNVDGTSWTGKHLISNSPPAPNYADRVRLIDANGNGTRDVFWGDASSYKYVDLQGGVRPWTLVHVQNGLGKTTDLQYSTSTQLMLAAAAAGKPWTSVTPEPVHVITQVTDRDNLDVVGRPAGVYVTQYSYANPVYEGRQREFRGFSSATSTRLGDANSPTSTTSSTFLLGQCSNDENLPVDPCSEQGRWEDNPREALKGLPLASEMYDTSKNYLSTSHHTYRLRKLYEGLDGREVRYAFESQGDSFLYDDGPFVLAPSATTLSDVELELTPGSINPSDTVESLALRSSIGPPPNTGAHTHRSAIVDLFGNTQQSTDDGVLHVDDSITTTTTTALVTLPQGQGTEPSGWMYRTVESYVTSTLFPVRRKDKSFTFDPGGNPVVTSGVLQGTLPLYRIGNSSGMAQTPPPFASSQTATTITIDTKQYSPEGELVLETGANARCRQIVYDAAFGELPVTELVFTGAATPMNINGSAVACGGLALATTAAYDRGLGTVVQVTEPRNEVTTAMHDGFGRITALSKPDPQNVGSPSTAPSVLISYTLPTNPAVTPYAIINTQTQDGSNASVPSYRNTWSYADGLGRTIVTLEEADPNAGDLGQWVVTGMKSYDAKGAAQRAYLAWFWSGTPQQFPLSTMAPTAYSSQRYDAFGRQLQTYGLDGVISLQSVHHALSVDKWDAADVMPGSHQGTPASVAQDGHGRTVLVQDRIHNGGAIETHDTRTTFQSTGEPAVIARVNEATGATVTRWIVYDSLGRMVLNAEPDTTAGYVPPPAVDPLSALSSVIPATMRSWRYAYDDAGDLVGTSDASGCGENYFYDAGARIIAEDFSPCLEDQPPYTSPNTSTGDGTEAFYFYDALDPSVPQSVATSAPFAFAVNHDLYQGRLSSESDRGARTATAYDGRGRVTANASVLPAPGIPSAALATRYASHWFERSTSYDGADRPTIESTAADAAGLTDSSGDSVVTTTYSQRGTVSSVGSSYGALVTGIIRAADGPIEQIVYGDVAGTTTAFTYDSRRRLSSVQTYRGPPAIWSQPPPSYLPPPAPTGPPSTFQLLLQDLDYAYDAVDNPTQITDYRNAAEWPAGTQPVTRKLQYDDLYRVTGAAYSYPAGSDPWVDPFQAEDEGIPSQQDPRRSKPSPHRGFAGRVLSQTFQYDWLGNTAQSSDDANGFYDRSLGIIVNGTGQGPYQLQAATGANGSLSAAYDASGNLVSLAVARAGACLPVGAVCSQRFAYLWDEAGRLMDARRWDAASPGLATDPLPSTVPDAELQYAYDASDERTLKTAIGAGGALASAGGGNMYSAHVFDSLELRGTTWDGTDYVRTSSTEVAFLDAHGVRLARLHYALEDEPSASSGQLHVLFELPDHMGSTDLVVDHDTSELVEATTYYPLGARESDYRPARWASFREDYGFSSKEDDPEVGLLYFGKRYLNPALGRWASADPLAVQTAGADLNLYAYVHGQLYVAIDPSGLADDDPPSGFSIFLRSLATTGWAVRPTPTTPANLPEGLRQLHEGANAEVAWKGANSSRLIAAGGGLLAAAPPLIELSAGVAYAAGAGWTRLGQTVGTRAPWTIPLARVVGTTADALGSSSMPTLPGQGTMIRPTIPVSLTTQEIGAAGEAVARWTLVARNYEEITSIQNKSGQGIDIIARNSVTKMWEFFEVKATSTYNPNDLPLKGDQNSIDTFVLSRLQRAINNEGGGYSDATRKIASDVLNEIKASGQQITGEVIEVLGVGKDKAVVRGRPWQ